MSQAGERNRTEDRVLGLARAYTRLDRVRRSFHVREIDLPGGRMSHSRFTLLDVLSEHEPVSTGGLAEAAGYSQATVSRMIAPLVSQGLVDRTPMPSDRRATLLSVTDRGQDSLRRRRRYWADRWIAAFKDFGDDETAVGLDLLERITRVYERLEEPVGDTADPR
jgi:DNA-binding MarR family transcriptional regulator